MDEGYMMALKKAQLNVPAQKRGNILLEYLRSLPNRIYDLKHSKRLLIIRCDA